MFTIESNISATPGAISIVGEVTIGHAAELFWALRRLVESGAEWEVDVSRIVEIDSAGIQVLLAAKRLASQCGGGFRLVRHSAALVDSLDMACLTQKFGDPIVIPAAG